MAHETHDSSRPPILAAVKWGMEKDLLPWVLGSALIAAGALAAMVEFTRHTPTAPVNALLAAPPAVTPVPAAATPTVAAAIVAAPIVAALAAAAPASLPATVFPAPDAGATGVPATGPASADASANGGPQLPPGEIWQCVVNGQKIFSDKRCGNGASVRQIGDVNVMDAPTPAPWGYRPGPGYAGAPYPAGPSYPDDQDDTGLDSDGYVGQQIILARERARREHHRQDTHPHAAANRGSPGPHNPR